MRTAIVNVATICLLVSMADNTLGTRQTMLRAALIVRVDTLGTQYGALALGQSVVLRGEPLDIDFGVINQHNGPKVAAELNWPAHVSLQLHRGGRLADTNAPFVASLQCEGQMQRLSTVSAEERDGHLILSSSGSQYYRCRIDPERYELSGVYTLSARWLSTTDSSPLRHDYESRLIPRITFELREIQTAADELDRDIHLAMRAIYHRRDAVEAERLAGSIILREPSSTTARIVRAEARAALGRCAEAREDWLQAARLAESGSVAIVQPRSPLPDDKRRSLARDWREKARQIKCP